MIEQRFGPRRCRDSRKPSLDQCPDAAFYRCEICGTVFWHMGIDLKEKHLTCCEEPAKHLLPRELEAMPSGIVLDYQITGGYNDNAVSVSWKSGISGYRPEWIFLKTFTGGYMKYVSAQKRSPMRFSLADLDAFAYCDKDPCLECTFRCKRGFVIYVYEESEGLFQIPMDHMSPYWQSRE